MTSHRDYEEVIINVVFVYDKNKLWFYNTTSAKIFFGHQKNKIKTILKVFAGSISTESQLRHHKCLLRSFRTKRNFPFSFPSTRDVISHH